MTDKEVMQQALDALTDAYYSDATTPPQQKAAIIALREAIAQPVQTATKLLGYTTRNYPDAKGQTLTEKVIDALETMDIALGMTEVNQAQPVQPALKYYQPAAEEAVELVMELGHVYEKNGDGVLHWSTPEAQPVQPIEVQRAVMPEFKRTLIDGKTKWVSLEEVKAAWPQPVPEVRVGTETQRMDVLKKSMQQYGTQQFSNLSNQVHGFAQPPQQSAQSAPSITMQDAIDAGDGALHGAIDYWQSKCEELEKKLAQSAQPAEVQLTPRRAYGEDYLEGVNVDRLERALTQLGVATCEREEMAARMAGYVNEITAAVMRHCEFLQSKPVEVQRVGTDMDAAAKVFADCMDYPWDFMTEQGRDWMRANTQSVLDAADGIKPASSEGNAK